MKAAAFAYCRPATVEDTVAELQREEAKVIAGGQSLVPVLAMRLARPRTLVDINSVAGLGRLDLDDDALRIGATVRQRCVELDARAGVVPLLGLALPSVGHRELRSRGTVCGSLAHDDPAAELPSVLACLGGSVEITGPTGFRRVTADQFFLAAMTTATQPHELVTAAFFPIARRGEGFGFGEFARRHGDFALAGVCVKVSMAQAIVATIACFGVADGPVVRDVSGLLESMLTDGPDTTEDTVRDGISAVAGDLAYDIVDTDGDVHASREYRRTLLSVLLSREIARAYHDAVRSMREVS
jgi:carbon-monoxide dehydrogenase medium subunit